MHIKLKYGNTNTFFIRGMSGNLLVDTDYAGTLPAFYRAIKDCKIKISDITYILATRREKNWQADIKQKQPCMKH